MNSKLPPTLGSYDRLAYPVTDACRLLSIGRTSLYEMAKMGEIRLIKIAGRTLVPHSELQRLTEGQDGVRENTPSRSASD